MYLLEGKHSILDISEKHLLFSYLSWKLKWAFLMACCLSFVCPSVNFSHFQRLLHNHWANFDQTYHKAFLGGGDSNLFKWGPRPFPMGDNSEIVKLYWKYLKIFFSRTTGPIFTKHGTKHPWMEEIHVYSNERPRPFSRGNNSKTVK